MNRRGEPGNEMRLVYRNYKAYPVYTIKMCFNSINNISEIIIAKGNTVYMTSRDNQKCDNLGTITCLVTPLVTM